MAEPCRSQGFALFGKIKCECVARSLTADCRLLKF